MLDLASLTKFNKLLADPVSNSLFGPARAEAAKAESARKEYLGIIDRYDAKRRHVGYTLSQDWLKEQVKSCAIRQFQYIPAAQAVEGFWKTAETGEAAEAAAVALDDYYELLQQEINDKDGFLKRKKIEIALADYIESKCAPLAPELNLVKLSEKLRNCRTAGNHGIRFGDDWARREIMWDAKCGQSKLCPFESREEGQRLAEKYLPTVQRFADISYFDAKAKKKRNVYKIHFGVLTRKNVPYGQLAREKNELFELTGRLIDTAKYLSENYYSGSKKVRRRKGGETDEEYKLRMQQEISIKSIRGALVVQEDPVGTSPGWNVHNNIIFITCGHFNYDDASAWMRANLNQLSLGGARSLDPAKLSSSFLELCKYQVAAIIEKSHDENHKSAPGMLEWPPEIWLEWYRANRGFRRTRSYGVLFDLDDAKDEGAEEDGEEDGESEFVKLGRVAYDRAAGVFAIGAGGDNAIFLIKGDKSRFQLFKNCVKDDASFYTYQKTLKTPLPDKSPTSKIKKK